MTPSTTPPETADAVDPAKTAKFLANLKRTIQKPDPDDGAPAQQPAPEPVMAEVPTPPTPPKPAKRRGKPAKPPAAAPADEGVSVNIKLDPGTATKVVYIRVDKTLADRLQLIAFQNKISNSGGPSSINDIGIEALTTWLDTQAA